MAEEKTHNWTPEETEALIQWRSDNEFLFTGKRNSSISGWEDFVTTSGFVMTAKQAKKKWNNLKAKYKELCDLPKGNGVEAGSVTVATWQWYSRMDAVLHGKHSVNPPLVAANVTATAASTPSAPDGATASRPPKKRARDTDAVLQFLNDQAERERETLARAEARARDNDAVLQFLNDQAERERATLAREEARGRENDIILQFLNDQAERERENLAREEANERHINSILQFLKDQDKREEERERRALARYEERERVADARAERFLALFEKLVNKF